MAQRRSTRDFRDLSGMRAGLYARVSKVTGGDERSTEQQEAEGREWAAREGVDLAAVYKDPGISASQFETRQRDAFLRMRADVEAGKLDVLWVWALNRQQRDLAVFAEMRELFQRKRVALSVSGKLHDPADYSDWMMLGFQALMDEKYSQDLSVAICRGKDGAAAAGRPAGHTPYGYRRVYDLMTREFVRQEPDYDSPTGRVEDSPAWIVREMITRVAAGHSITGIARDLNRRGITTAQGVGWSHTTVRGMVMNPTYIAKRVHQGRIVEGVTAKWPALVSEDVFWSAHRILTDRARPTHRDSRAKTLLTHIARCGACGDVMQGVRTGTPARPMYKCKLLGCAAVDLAELDAYVSETVAVILSDPDLFAAVSEVDDSETVVRARADAAQARVELEEWRRLAGTGDIDPAGYAAASQRLHQRIGDAERVVADAHVPPVLRDHIGPHVRDRWAGLPLEVQRGIVREVLDIRVYPVGGGGGRRMPVEERVWLRPLIGETADDEADAERFAATQQRWEADRAEKRRRAHDLRASGMKWSDVGAQLGVSTTHAKKLADIDPLGGVSVRPKKYRMRGEPVRRARRQRAAELRRQGWTYRAIGAELGVTEYTAYKDVKRAREEGGTVQ